MNIYLFCDESDNEIFAFSIDPTGGNLPPATPHTEWLFLETIDTLRFPEPWDIDDFGDVLERLKADGFYLFRGELIDPMRLIATPPAPDG